jgi:type II secretory pathway pseudopilin PulG
MPLFFRRIQRAVTKAFTLAELLVLIVIIGVISALTIPNVWSNTEEVKRRALIQSTFNTFEEHFVRENFAEEHTLPTATRWANLRNVLQHDRVCGFGGSPQATCTSPGDTTTDGGGFRLQTGAWVYNLMDSASATSTADVFTVDVNGNGLPNKNCKDRFPYVVNHQTGVVEFSGCTVTYMQ